MGWTALAYHNAQLEASAFREEFDNEAFEDLTEPKIDMMHRVRILLLCLEGNVDDLFVFPRDSERAS